MRKRVYNLEFPPWCPAMTIYGYKFSRVPDYPDRVAQLQHLGTAYSEFPISANTGQHAFTAYVELPEHEDRAVLEWADSDNTALNDVLLLLSIFTGRDVFAVEDEDKDIGVILADPRQYKWGGVLICSISYKEQPADSDAWEFGYDIGREEGLNQIYGLIRSEEWQRKYEHGYFLFLANQAFHRQTLESSFIQCWTIWEHLFTVHNRNWLSAKQIRQLDSSEKIAFILTEYVLKDEIDDTSRKRIASLAEIRNRLVHFGKFPERSSVHDDAVLFIRLTEFVIVKILGLSPSNVFNTVERLEEFLNSIKPS
jgi:hypothetical protein